MLIQLDAAYERKTGKNGFRDNKQRISFESEVTRTGLRRHVSESLKEEKLTV